MCNITTVFLLFVLLAVNGASEVKQQKEPRKLCPLGWRNYERQCYKLFKIGKQWNEAKKQCLASKGHLASVHKPADNAFLKTFVQKQARHIWIGGNYATQKAAWAWSDGSYFGYTNWITKPVIARNHKRCVLAEVTKGVLRWRNADCRTRHYFVCYKMAVKH